MKTLELEGKLIKASSNMKSVTYRFENNLKYLRNENISKVAYVCIDNDWQMLFIDDISFTVLWDEEEPRVALDVTFSVPKNIDVALKETIRFHLSEDDISDTVEIAL